MRKFVKLIAIWGTCAIAFVILAVAIIVPVVVSNARAAEQKNATTVAAQQNAFSLLDTSAGQVAYGLLIEDNWSGFCRQLNVVSNTSSHEGVTTTVLRRVGSEDQIVLLSSDLWETTPKGEYVDSPNGARYLRYMVTLGEDIESRDPLLLQSASKSKAYQILSAWNGEMQAALASEKLRVLGEDPAVKWMQTQKKTEYSRRLLDDATTMVYNYTFGRKSLSEYRTAMTSSRWTEVLAEINSKLNSQG